MASNSPPPSGITSVRKYRSRLDRPCDRCRSRKARCVVPEAGRRCLNCDLAGVDCLFEKDAAPDHAPRRKRQRKEDPESPAIGNSLDLLAAASEVPFGLANVTTEASSGAVPSTSSLPYAPLPLSAPSYSQFLPLPAATGGTNLKSTDLATLLGNISGTVSVEGAHAVVNQVTEGVRPLDAEANEDEELYYCGTAVDGDALILSHLAATSTVAGQEGAAKGKTPGIKLRYVSRDPPEAFHYHVAKPYRAYGAFDAMNALKSLLGGQKEIDRLLKLYNDIDRQALPIFDKANDLHAARDVVQCACIASAIIYEPSPERQNLYHEAWGIALSHLHTNASRARLFTVQSTLVMLNGRRAINAGGNFISLANALSVAKLLGLHKDCSRWSIPASEKLLRNRIFQALRQHDAMTAITFNREPMLNTSDCDELHPLRLSFDTPADDAFASLYELTLILVNGFFERMHTQTTAERLHQLSIVGLRIDQWRRSADTRNLFAFTTFPGVDSLHLTYLFGRLVCTKQAWDLLEATSYAAVQQAQKACLSTATGVVDFVEKLSDQQLQGYWSSHAPFFLSACLTALIRLVVSSDRTATTFDAFELPIWQDALYTLRRFVTALRQTHQWPNRWDIAELTLGRAEHYVPLLSEKAPEFGNVLQPLLRPTHDASSFKLPPPDLFEGLGLDSLFDFNLWGGGLLQ